ncbi:MFS transporter [Candidatus Entotheonella serta]|nr:MFS transporter [Candidatus Entotheonella serta]
MKPTRAFIKIASADLIVRSAYQMGKTPLLPIFAATLGASGPFLGLIASVSTCTGLLLKPLIGMLSDRWGRRGWLVMGTLVFTLMPFSYRFVQRPEHLLILRVLHGMATVIYGPVTLAYVAEHAQRQRAETLGWFGVARNIGYIVGPALAGGLLAQHVDPVQIFTLIGWISALAMIPVLRLPESAPLRTQPLFSFSQHVRHALRAGSCAPSIWLAGSLEAIVLIALYAAKIFLPLYAISLSISIALGGLFLALQETVYMLGKPFGGRLGDRFGYCSIICLGMVALGSALTLLTWAQHAWSLLALAIVIGAAQALIFPATVALVAAQIEGQHLGAGLGLLGTLKNAGKVIGPMLGGLLSQWLDFPAMFQSMGGLLIIGAGAVWFGARHVSTGPAQSSLFNLFYPSRRTS